MTRMTLRSHCELKQKMRSKVLGLYVIPLKFYSGFSKTQEQILTKSHSVRSNCAPFYPARCIPESQRPVVAAGMRSGERMNHHLQDMPHTPPTPVANVMPSKARKHLGSKKKKGKMNSCFSIKTWAL